MVADLRAGMIFNHSLLVAIETILLLFMKN